MDLWEYMMLDRPVSIKGQRSANREDERASYACWGGKKRAMDGEKGRAGGDKGRELWDAAALGRLLARRIPAGSPACNRRDPQNQPRSKVRQALTFPEKIPCPSPLLHSFASSWFTCKTSLASILIPGLIFHNARHFFPHPAAPTPPRPNCYFLLDYALKSNNNPFPGQNLIFLLGLKDIAWK